MTKIDSKKLSKAYADLSHRYRNTGDKKGVRSKDEALAYSIARMPATYASVKKCLDEFPSTYTPKTVLDVGAGPGTASTACLDRYPDCAVTLIEDDPHMLDLGQKSVPNGHWVRQRLSPDTDLPPADVVILSYVLNELPLDEIPAILGKLWQAACDYLIITTPGTPAAFEQLKQTRTALINLGAHLVAPCPHALACPMTRGDWCHFKVRIQRTSLHRTTKGGDLGYEDEKYSYLIVSKHPQDISYDRVTKSPHHRSKHGSFEVCSSSGSLETKPYSKSKSPDYKILKDLDWGDRT